uniref:Uncharacterized protein n=1 Tax=Setaria viridis TaxID=4556 RepID=A0A4U6UNT9_SETVI|nr:hypothetical protein SEVIR_5G413350v2 [Setaria viridis]
MGIGSHPLRLLLLGRGGLMVGRAGIGSGAADLLPPLQSILISPEEQSSDF